MKFANLTTCPHCGGKVRAESIGWKCEKCRGFIDMQGNFHEYVEKSFMPTMTNADRIRSMSDEELAEYLVYHNPYHTESNCLKWLKQPAEEKDNEAEP